MTATERRYKGQSDTVLSMDDPATYGETFHLLSFKRAMEYDPPILSDYKIITIAVSRDEVAELIRGNTFVRPDIGPWNEQIEADMLASLIALRKAMKKYPIRHAVSFHGSIQRAELFKAHNDKFSKTFRRYGKLETFHVSGKTSTGTRSRIIGEFSRADSALITNARCLTEGVDVPGIDCVLFADPRRSAVDIVQAVGRALRPAPGKKFGYVIVPILHDADATADDLFRSLAFKEILTTLRALAANDDRIIEYFQNVAYGRQSKGGASVLFDINERLAKSINIADFVREIELKCWDKLAKLSWRSFEEARDFARGLALKGEAGWRLFCKRERSNRRELAADIPVSPAKVYSNCGWKSWGDWLGTGMIATQQREKRPFPEARDFVRNLSLKNLEEWRQYCKGTLSDKGIKPEDIPSEPAQSYVNEGWQSLGDWLGTGTVAPFKRKYLPFYEARAFARNLGLRNREQWEAFCRGDMPEKGTLPMSIPKAPHNTYALKGWVSMGDWLGTGRVANNLRSYRSFNHARAFVHRLGLRSGDEWKKYIRGEFPQKGVLPQDIPAAPQIAFAGKGWIGMGDWLGTGIIASRLRQYRPFGEARAFARSLNLKSGASWKAFCRCELPEKGILPHDIPKAPGLTYAGKGWVSMGDWLGTGIVASQLRRYRAFENARKFARGLGLKGEAEWREFRKGNLPEKGILPADIPSTPNEVYAKNGWVSWGDWLGKERVANRLREYRTFDAARAFVRDLHLKGEGEWRQFRIGKMPEKGVLPSNIPASPHSVYAGRGWVGWGDWLGTVRTRRRKV